MHQVVPHLSFRFRVDSVWIPCGFRVVAHAFFFYFKMNQSTFYVRYTCGFQVDSRCFPGGFRMGLEWVLGVFRVCLRGFLREFQVLSVWVPFFFLMCSWWVLGGFWVGRGCGLWINNFSVQNCVRKIFISQQQKIVLKIAKCQNATCKNI